MFIKREDLQELVKEAVRDVVREEVQAALNRTITVQKGPDKNGDPEAKVETQELNILDFLATYLPDIEGRLLGMQEDVESARNRVNEQTEKIDAVGNTLLALHDSSRKIAALAEAVRGQGFVFVESGTGKKPVAIEG